MTKNKKSKKVDNESDLSDFDLFADEQSECDKLAKPASQSTTTTKKLSKEPSKPKPAVQSSPKVIASTSTKSTISITKISKPNTNELQPRRSKRKLEEDSNRDLSSKKVKSSIADKSTTREVKFCPSCNGQMKMKLHYYCTNCNKNKNK